ncbi:MAG: BTAD domain-containing putative transcriptional regulator [Chloroflexota bacterium]
MFTPRHMSGLGPDFIAQFSEPVLALDEKLRVVDLNTAAAELLGQPVSAVLDHPCWEALDGRDPSTNLPCYASCPLGSDSQYEWSHVCRLLVGPEAETRRLECVLLRCVVGEREVTLIFPDQEAAMDPWAPAHTFGESAVTHTPAFLLTPDPRQAARGVLESAIKATGALGGRIMLHGADRSNGDYVTNMGDCDVAGFARIGDATIHDHVTRLRSPCLTLCRLPNPDGKGRRPGSAICVPLIVDDRVEGTITLWGASGHMAIGRAMRRLFPLASQFSVFLRWTLHRDQWSAPSEDSDLPTGRLKIKTLGPFGLEIDGRPVPPSAFRRKRSLDLLKRLAASESHSLAREEAAELLWPEADPERSSTSLRVTLHGLRHGLEPELRPGEASSFIGSDGARIWLVTDLIETDAETFLAERRHMLTYERLGYETEALRSGKKAVDAYTGPFMADEPYGEWCEAQRARLHEMFIDTALRTGALEARAGDWNSAAETYHRALLAEPVREEAYRGLMTAHWQAGRPGEALAQYARCVHVLRDTLGIEPAPETSELTSRIRATLKRGHKG